VVVVVVSIFLGATLVARRVLPETGDLAPGLRIYTIYLFVFMAGIILLQLFNVATFRELWPFYLGLLALTTHSLFTFAFILFAPSQSEVQA